MIHMFYSRGILWEISVSIVTVVIRYPGILFKFLLVLKLRQQAPNRVTCAKPVLPTEA